MRIEGGRYTGTQTQTHRHSLGLLDWCARGAYSVILFGLKFEHGANDHVGI